MGVAMAGNTTWNTTRGNDDMAGEPATSAELVERLKAIHANQLRLCSELEAIADSLPDNLDPKACLSIARMTPSLLKQAHDFEEGSLFSLLRERLPDDAELADSLERLRYEHWEDESYAEEISAVLMDWAMCTSRRSAEATGYMLRGFFEGLRRHIAFEREHIVPIILGSDTAYSASQTR
ncbi:MAG: hemerythrin domain-containing protein [Nitratireductor sp.]|nr:hemerythrin domain-containing protein [Nitratireductor sp.]